MPLLLPECKMTFVCGPVSSGKTFLIKEWLERDNRHVIFDGSGEFLDSKGREEIWANPRALWERIKANPYYYRLVYQPGLNRKEDFGYVLNCLWWLDTPKLLVCDEFHEICPLESTTAEVERMLRFARHDKLGFVGASQRIADVHKLFTAGCRMVVLFWTQELRDLEAIQGRWACANMVSNLRPLLHDDVSGETKQVPQAVVCLKGQAPFIYDFATDSVRDSPHDSDQRETGAESGIGEPTAPAPILENDSEGKEENNNGS